MDAARHATRPYTSVGGSSLRQVTSHDTYIRVTRVCAEFGFIDVSHVNDQFRVLAFTNGMRCRWSSLCTVRARPRRFALGCGVIG